MPTSRFFSPWDIVIYLSLVVLLSFTFATKQSKANSKLLVVINTPTKQFIYAIEDYGHYCIEGLLGSTEIEISKAGVGFAASCCPNKDCMSGLPLQRAYQYRACLPNGIELIILPQNKISQAVKEDVIDAVSY